MAKLYEKTSKQEINEEEEAEEELSRQQQEEEEEEEKEEGNPSRKQEQQIYTKRNSKRTEVKTKILKTATKNQKTKIKKKQHQQIK